MQCSIFIYSRYTMLAHKQHKTNSAGWHLLSFHLPVFCWHFCRVPFIFEQFCPIPPRPSANLTPIPPEWPPSNLLVLWPETLPVLWELTLEESPLCQGAPSSKGIGQMPLSRHCTAYMMVSTCISWGRNNWECVVVGGGAYVCVSRISNAQLLR